MTAERLPSEHEAPANTPRTTPVEKATLFSDGAAASGV